ncbi:myb-related transcription factor, partner of profilin-like [Mytilus edulis]
MAESTEQNPSKLKRLKKTNFTVAEEDLIQQLVEKHSSVINGKLTNTVTNQLKKKVWDDIAIKVNSLGVAIRTATEVRNKWRNTTRVAKAVYTTHRSELFKTGGGPAPKQPSSAVEKVIHLMKDTTSFRGIQGGLETESFQTNQPSINATLPEEDASQDLYESAASLIRDSPPPSSPPSPSLLSGYDPILTQTVVPHIQEQTDRTDKQKTVRTPLKKVTVQDIHDMQYRALQGKL